MDLKRYIGKTKTLQQDIVRMLLILFYFGENTVDEEEENLKLVVKAEYYIQKLDFLLRNPDYLCYELLTEIVEGRIIDDEKFCIKEIVKEIFNNQEPVLRRIPMQRFFFGAYEQLDEVESFLTSVDFIRVRPQGTTERVQVKYYYLTQKGYRYIEEELIVHCNAVEWYNKRCQIIKEYLGSISASNLKNRQYEHDTYSQTRWGSKISTVIDQVKERYYQIFGEDLL